MTPQLRFPEFTDEWQVKRLDDYIKSLDAGVSVNSDDNRAGDGEIAILKTSCVTRGVFDYRENKRVIESSEIKRLKESVTKDTIIISRMNTPELVGANAYVDQSHENVYLPDRLWATKMYDNCSSRFIAYKLGSKQYRQKLSSIATGTSNSMKNISKESVRLLEIIAPSKPEQEKIADFLTAVDERIRLQEQKLAKLEQYKRGVMQQIFSQKIRFKDENGNEYPEWEEKKLGELFTRITDKNKLSNKNVLTISSELGLVNQLDYYNHSYASKDLSGYTLIRKGDFAYNKSYSRGYPMGAIKRLSRYDSGVVSPLYICFRAKENVCSEFFENYFEAGLFNSQIAKIAQEGARNHGLLNMSVVEFFEDTALQIPSLNEQQKIATFLTALDDKITAEKSKLTAAKQFKKALLQRMFV